MREHLAGVAGRAGVELQVGAVAALLPLPTRSTHLVRSAVIAIRQLAPSGTSVNFCAVPVEV